MYSLQIQPVAARPLIDIVSDEDYFLIGDASDNGTVKRVLLSTLKAYFGDPLPPVLQSLWLPDTVPSSDNLDDSVGYELAQQIQSNVNGSITAIRYYKASLETGTHIGKIWSSTGTLLASVTFADETASGWQEQSLTTPLAITANSSYIVSVNINQYYVVTNYPTPETFVRGDLSGASGGFFGSVGNFPTTSFNNNYFRDIVFIANG